MCTKKYNLFIITLFIFTIIVLLTACTSVHTVFITVSKPAPLSLPPIINDITIVNNAVMQPYNVGHSESIMQRESNTSISVNNDSIDYILMETIGEELDKKKYFDHINLYQYPTRLDSEYNKIVAISKESITSIANETNADIVVSIDKFFISTNINTLPAGDYIADNYNILDLKANMSYNLYNKNGEKLFSTITDQDSMFWVEARLNNNLLSDPIPDRESAMKTGAIMLGNKLVSDLVPYQQNETRIFYSDVKAAQKLASQNEWMKARDLWITAFGKEKNNKPKARIANNIALSYELSDNLDEALRWNQISIDLFKNIQITSVDKQYLELAETYKKILLERVQDFEILDLKEQTK